MTTGIIIICSLLLLAYVFDLSSALTKIPAVILLLLLGWVAKQAASAFEITIPGLETILPLLGTIGLILIVLEGALELELNKSKFKGVRLAALVALVPMLIMAFLVAWGVQYLTGADYKTALANVIPLCVISSAIAIPSVRNLAANTKEFIVYESSLSDIFGVLFFNFIVLNESINAGSFGHFALEILIIIVVSFVSVLGLSFLLSRIKHHITYTPIILLVILIYALSKVYHLPGLIFILVFGLFLGNLEELKNFKWIEKFRPEKLEKEVAKFKDITTEATFLVRALFFLVFGFSMRASEILNPETLPWACAIVMLIMVLRWLSLTVAKQPVVPLLFVAPRGLITILLFLAIEPSMALPLVNKALVIQIIVLTVLVMMFGLMGVSNNQHSKPAENTGQ